MEALLRWTSVVRRRQQLALLRGVFCKRFIGSDASLDETLANLSASILAKRGGVPHVRMRLHRDWKQVNDKLRRIETRVGDFRSFSKELQMHRSMLEVATTELEKTKVVGFIKQREQALAADSLAIHSDLLSLTALFVEGADREYAALRSFFLLFVFYTARTSSAYENLDRSAFMKLLTQTADGVSFEVPNRGTVTLRPHICKILAAAANSLVVNTAGVDTSPLSIALAVVQTFPQKHCGNRNCRREDCIAVKVDHEELFECFFKLTARAVVFQKVRGEMAVGFDEMLTMHEDKFTTPETEVYVADDGKTHRASLPYAAGSP